MDLFRDHSDNPKYNAQRNLQGRTHYVDDNTLRGFRARILDSRVTDGGLLFAIIESIPQKSEHDPVRVFRPVVFDLFGTVIDRVKLKDGYRTRKQAERAMWEALNRLDAKQITLDGIASARRYFELEMAELATKLNGGGAA